MKQQHFGMTKTPHAQHAHGVQQCFGIYVWAGIVDGHLIGPYLLPPRLMDYILSSCKKYWANYWKKCH